MATPDQVVRAAAQSPKSDKVQQERAEILGLETISTPIVTDEVYWPGVFTALTRATPSGRRSAASRPTRVKSAAPVAPTAGAPATATGRAGRDRRSRPVNISLQSPTGYPYFRNWYYCDQRVRQAHRRRLHRDFPGCLQADRYQRDGRSHRRSRFRPGQRIQGATMNRIRGIQSRFAEIQDRPRRRGGRDHPPDRLVVRLDDPGEQQAQYRSGPGDL